MMRNLMTAVLMIFYSTGLFAEKFISEIKSLPGEKWYGAYTAKAWCNTPLKNIRFQPFEWNTPKKDLNDNLGNQATPVLLSNMGRYVEQ